MTVLGQQVHAGGVAGEQADGLLGDRSGHAPQVGGPGDRLGDALAQRVGGGRCSDPGVRYDN